MKKITVEGAMLSVHSGNVTLTAEQARPRLHSLAAVKVDDTGAGVYSVRGEIQFKKGETFKTDGQVGKNGVVSDPDAEAMKDMEREAGIEARVKQAREEGRNAALAEMEAEIARRVEEEVAKASEKK